MSKIFDTFDIDYDHVSFRYTASRVKEHVFVDKPDGIGVTQWMDFWEGVKELYEDGRSLDEILDDAESDELAELRKSNDELEDDNYDLRNEVRDLERDNEKLESEIVDLENLTQRLEARISELEK